MPYITVRSVIRPAQEEGFPRKATLIDYYADFDEQDGLEIIQAAMARLGASRCDITTYRAEGVQAGQGSPWCVYSILRPPHYVLNGLENLAGYKVVASNSITEFCIGTSIPHSHHQIWTLHKQT